MKKIILSLALLLGLPLGAMAQEYNQRFSEIEIGGMFTATLTMGDKHSIRFDVPAEYQDKIEVEFEDDKVEISMEDIKTKKGKTPQFLVYITTPTLRGLEVEGMARVNCGEAIFASQYFELEIGGMGRVNGLKIKSEHEASLDIGGMGIVENLMLHTPRLECEVSGMAQVRDLDLRGCKHLESEVGGQGLLNLINRGAFDYVEFDISGMSKVNIQGESCKQMQLEISGMSQYNGKNLYVESGSAEVSGMSQCYTRGKFQNLTVDRGAKFNITPN